MRQILILPAIILCVGLCVLAEEIAPIPRQMTGGSGATAVEFPMAVYVTKDVVTNCTGVLLSRKWVLTAAHCVDGATSILLRHIGGESTLGYPRVDTRADYSWGTQVHPDYNPLGNEAGTKDLALIELSDDDALTSRYVKAVTLPSESHIAQIENGLNVTVLGVANGYWSQASWPLAGCENEREDWIVCVQMTIAQHIDEGDSGGPLLMRDGDDWVLVGTTFWTYGPGAQLAAQRTSYYLPWIAQYVDGVTAPPPPDTGTGDPPFRGVVVEFLNQTGRLCRVDDLFSPAPPVQTSTNTAVEIQIPGQRFQTVLLVECGQP